MKLFVWAVNQDGKGRYVHIDAIAIAEPSREGNGYMLKSASGKVLGMASAEHFSPDFISGLAGAGRLRGLGGTTSAATHRTAPGTPTTAGNGH